MAKSRVDAKPTRGNNRVAFQATYKEEDNREVKNE
jgi:hypothetical protein